MKRSRLKTFIGLAMVALGLIQAGAFAAQSEWIPTALGLLYSGIGVAYLWAEVYTVDR
ncbi:hypothetical protein [Halostella litorea]|uniref:hypothetical protein n=1 Tax=Halostella litorea TaxID=2528831 RepID=UPI00192A4B6A|nr:hypothetical protein [Halostella litorea]